MRGTCTQLLAKSVFLLLSIGWQPVLADETQDAVAGDSSNNVPADTDSGSLDDSMGTIADMLFGAGWNSSTDIRLQYNDTDTDFTPGSGIFDNDPGAWQTRLRAGGSYNFSDELIVGTRLATTCTQNNCDFNIAFNDNVPVGATSIPQGDVTFDELYIHSFRREKFDVAFGRLQTKFVSHAGVFANSLDRGNSSGVNVTWTDGIHGVLHFTDKSRAHLILQRNRADGAGSVRRAPLDFSSKKSRITYFAAWNNLQASGPFIQRGLDVSFLPSSLLQDGDPNGVPVNYLALVGRAAASWPKQSDGRRLTVGAELGYSPTTPTKAAVGLPGEGFSGGFAWNLSISGMDIWPDHNIGVNLGQTDAGWLLSPDYVPNTEVLEIRYLWRRSKNMALDMRARWRQSIKTPEGSAEQPTELNVFIRVTLGLGR